MKKILLTVGLFFISSLSFAIGCGNLGIKIINATNQECVLKNKTVFYGLYDKGVVPNVIPSGTTSNEFFMQQDYVGVGVQLGYQCGDKKIKFYSYQDFCGISAGEVGGFPDVWNELDMQYTFSSGSYLFGLPGQITWLIH